MARKIIRAADRDKAREESKKAAEAVPVKDSWGDIDAHVDMSKCNHASAVLNTMSRVFKCPCGAEFTEKFALMNGLACVGKGKPGKIQSVSDFGQLSFSAIEDAMVKGNGINPGWYPYPKPQPPDFTLDDMIKFVGAPSPGEEIKYRTDGVIVYPDPGFIYATDLKCSIRVEGSLAPQFGVFTYDNGDVTCGLKEAFDSATVVGYVGGKAGCNGTDLETPPMHKMPWVAVSGNSAPLSGYTVEPAIETIKCPSATCDNGFHKKCPSCSGLGCKSCANKGGTPCYVCMGCKHIRRISGYRFIPKHSAGEFILAPDLYNKIVGLPDLGIYPSKFKGVIGFDFRVNKNHRGQGLCITMDEPKVTNTKPFAGFNDKFSQELAVKRKEQEQAWEEAKKQLAIDPSKTMLSGSGGSVGKTNTNAVEFAKMVKMFPATHDGFSGPSTIMGMGVKKKLPKMED